MSTRRELHKVEEKFIPKNGSAGRAFNIGDNFKDIVEQLRCSSSDEIAGYAPQLVDYVKTSLAALVQERREYEQKKIDEANLRGK